MFLVGHSAIGISLSLWTGNPLLAFVIGFASHFLGDAVPHGDEPLGEWAKRGNYLKRMLFVSAIDGLMVLIALAWLFTLGKLNLVMLAAAVGACAPDVMWGLETATKRKLFGTIGEWHHRNHNFLKIRIPVAVAAIGQVILTVGLWWWIGAR